MGRAALVALVAVPLLASSWLRIEDGSATGEAALIVVLALLPALVPGRRRRAAAAAIAFLIAGAVAFDLGLSWGLPGRIFARFGSGFLEFYDVQIPFAPEAHPRMHGVLLLAVFAFVLAVGLAAAACRPGLVALALVIGVGWPGTLLPGDDLLRGALLLAAVLATTALVRRGPLRGLGTALVAGSIVLVAAVAASTSPALAKRAFLDWQRWDPYTKPAKPVDVSYVWNSSYRGLTFRGKPTTVFRVNASPRPRYWRVSVLNSVENGRWFEELSPEYGAPVILGESDLIPARQAREEAWEPEHVTIEALRDHRLPGGSIPVRFRTGERLGDVQYDPSGVAYAGETISRGDSYDVWSYSPSPTPAQLASSRPVYPAPIASSTRKYREVQPGVYPKLFGRPNRAAFARYLLTDYALANELQPYKRLYALAERVAGGARSPYAAAVALERWFRFAGGFVYDQHPPKPPPGVEPLEDFVANSKAGYCQQFAGAMTLMLRYLGIPSRVAVGFVSGRYHRKGHEWVVSDRDAHMWVEVWFNGWGWLPFDPTPGRSGLSGQYSTSSPNFDLTATAAVLRSSVGLRKFAQGLAEQLGFNGPPRVSPDVPDPGALIAAPTSSDGHARAWGLARLLLYAIAGAVLLLAAAKLLVRGSRFLTRDPRRLAGASRKELRDYLLDQGLDVPRSATLRELAALVESEFGVAAGGFGLHATVARFGPRAGAREAARAMRRDLRKIRRGIRRELSVGERLRGVLSLRSLGLA